jgi:hypothetical protein
LKCGVHPAPRHRGAPPETSPLPAPATRLSRDNGERVLTCGNAAKEFAARWAVGAIFPVRADAMPR